MDHSHHMDHSMMDHSGHDGHSGMGMDMCSMNMLFTWDTTNLCIVFPQWHIRTTPGLLFSLLAIVAIGIGYEAIRAGIRRYELAMGKRIETMPSGVITETTPLAWAGQNQEQAGKKTHLIKALLYAFQTFYAFMLMLIFMTYNGWVMAAVTIGAFVGYAVFGGQTSATKETQCH